MNNRKIYSRRNAYKTTQQKVYNGQNGIYLGIR